VHTVMILVIIFLFAFTAYATSSVLGSPGVVYDKLVAAAERHPVRILSSVKRHVDMGGSLCHRSRGMPRVAISRCAPRKVSSSSSSIWLATSEPCSAITDTSMCCVHVSLYALGSSRRLRPLKAHYTTHTNYKTPQQQSHSRLTRACSTGLHLRRPILVRHSVVGGMYTHL